jgi:Glycosyltransferase
MDVLFLTTNRFTDGSAGSQRELVLGKLLRFLGYDVCFCTLADAKYGEIHEFKSFQYVTLRKSGKSLIKRFFNYFNYSKNLKRLLADEFSNQIIKKIVVTDIPWNAFEFVLRYAKRKKIDLIHNSVEWYSPQEYHYGRLSIEYNLNNFLNTTIIRNPMKVIGISSYLTAYFRFRNIRALRLPFIVDTETIKCEKRCSFDKLVLLYAGNATGRKDYLKEMIEGLSVLSDNELNRIEFRIFGVSDYSIINDCKVDQKVLVKLKDTLKMYGKVPHEVVLSHLREAHFTPLLRSETLRYAKAGFPTKITESLASGTPVICNITSDLGMFIRDGIEGLIVSSCSADAFAEAIRRALLLSSDEMLAMQIAARECVENKLDYRNYSEEMKSFLEM